MGDIMLLKASDGLMPVTIEFEGNKTETKTIDVFLVAQDIAAIYKGAEGIENANRMATEAVRDYMQQTIGFSSVPMFTAEQFIHLVMDEAEKLKKSLLATPAIGASPESPDTSDSTPELSAAEMQSYGNG